MITAGFDFVAELNERFLNRAIAAAFYTTPISDPRTGNERGFEYSIKLVDPPTIDSMIANTVRALFYVNVRIKKFGLTFEFDIKAKVDAAPLYDKNSRTLRLDVKQANVEELDIGDKKGWLKIFSWKVRLPRFILNFFNRVLAAIINMGLLDKYETLQLPSVLYSLDLPAMPPGEQNQLTIGLSNVRCLNSSVLAVCINFLQYNGGNIAQLTDFSDGLDLCSGVSEAAMHRVFDFWWDRTTLPKSVNFAETWDIPGVDELVDVLGATAITAAMAVAFGGMIFETFEAHNARIEYGADVSFKKPSFSLLNGDSNLPAKLDASCELAIHIWGKIKIDITVTTYYVFGIFHSDPVTNTITIDLPTLDIPLKIDHAVLGIYLEDNRLKATIEDVEDVEIQWDLPNEVLDHVWSIIKPIIIRNIPPFTLTPAVITTDIPSTGLTCTAEIDKLETTDDDAIVGASLSISKIDEPVMPFPEFVVDSSCAIGLVVRSSMPSSSTSASSMGENTSSSVVHRIDCALVNDILERNKVGVYVLADALAKGNKPCPECLPEYQPSSS